MSIVQTNYLEIVTAINNIYSGSSELTTWDIYPNADEDQQKTVNTDFKKFINLWDYKNSLEQNHLPENAVICTFLATVEENKPDFMSVYKAKTPMIFTEVCVPDFQLESAIEQAWKLAFKCEEVLEEYGNGGKKLTGKVKTCSISEQNQLGIIKHSELGYHGVIQMKYAIKF